MSFVRTDVGTWMYNDPLNPTYSVARIIATEAMAAMGLDTSDFRQRDRVIGAISRTVNGAMDGARGYKQPVMCLSALVGQLQAILRTQGDMLVDVRNAAGDYSNAEVAYVHRGHGGQSLCRIAAEGEQR